MILDLSKIKAELAYEIQDAFFTARLQEILDDQNWGIDNWSHPEDIKLAKKVRKACKTLLKYYGAE